MCKNKTEIKDALPCRLSSLCPHCLKREIRKVVSINENINVHFCDSKDCEKSAVSEAEDILKSLRGKNDE